MINFPYKRNTHTPRARKLSRGSDADTIIIEQPLRLVSCDSPEKTGYAGKPEVSQTKLDKCKERLDNGFYNEIPQGLREYLSNKITKDTAKRHIDAGMDAIEIFERMLSDRLTLPNGDLQKKENVCF